MAVVTPDAIEHLRDLCYGTVGNRQLYLDLARPDPLPDAAPPLVVYIHGGGWMEGSKADGSCNNPLAQGGFCTASLDYRLSREATFPAQLDDVRLAIRWLRSHAATYHFDPARIGVWGHSAGGHLAALLGVDAPTDTDGGVQAVVAISAPTDLRRPGDWNEGPDGMVTQLFGAPPDERPQLATAASPITKVRPGVPPFVLVHGELDEIVPVDQAKNMYAALSAVHADATLILQSRADHGFSTGNLNWEAIGRLAYWTFAHHLDLGR